jgi:hypothetical protein
MRFSKAPVFAEFIKAVCLGPKIYMSKIKGG